MKKFMVIINHKNINTNYAWDIFGRPFHVLLDEMSLPSKIGGLLVAGTPEKPVKFESIATKSENGHFFTQQVISLVFGVEITATEIAFYINFLFGISICILSFS